MTTHGNESPPATNNAPTDSRTAPHTRRATPVPAMSSHHTDSPTAPHTRRADTGTRCGDSPPTPRTTRSSPATA
ncbi:hypothetical protein, partial [Streptomyces acidiscabies]|uniref:hypothetical protein n=1 Tax=Streptomyces acidiscabies TaxID=42234 RepID=UPI001C4BA90A